MAGLMTKETNEWLPNSELPEGSIPTAALLIVNYIDSDGLNRRLVSAKGESQATTYLGMTVYAQQDILDWDQINKYED